MPTLADDPFPMGMGDVGPPSVGNEPGADLFAALYDSDPYGLGDDDPNDAPSIAGAMAASATAQAEREWLETQRVQAEAKAREAEAAAARAAEEAAAAAEEQRIAAEEQQRREAEAARIVNRRSETRADRAPAGSIECA
eukprot:4973413-Prymnesium_polylepis.1